MQKSKIIQELHKARPEHVALVIEGRKLLKGIPEEKAKKPQQCTACNFGLWYDSEGHKLVNIPQLKKMQELHKDIHTAYTSLYYTTFDRRKKARSTILSGNTEIPIDELPFRKQKLKTLEMNTIKMLKTLVFVERKVSLMKEQDFDNGWLN